jgi:hypothetical protein
MLRLSDCSPLLFAMPRRPEPREVLETWRFLLDTKGVDAAQHLTSAVRTPLRAHSVHHSDESILIPYCMTRVYQVEARFFGQRIESESDPSITIRRLLATDTMRALVHSTAFIEIDDPRIVSSSNLCGPAPPSQQLSAAEAVALRRR